ncbi:restriction endonuclease, partial [Vibrio sp. F13]
MSEGGELLEQEKRILSETKKGFTYFEKDDVLLAKITPCFENGKAALLDDLETQLGFGSTEFHVLRAVEGKLDSKYLFHLVWNE